MLFPEKASRSSLIFYNREAKHFLNIFAGSTRNEGLLIR